MCGIAGAVYQRPADASDVARVRAMARVIAHRGPDEYGVSHGGSCVLASARLSIVDVANGHQPYRNEDGRVRVVFNGEIYNHWALREELDSKGHRLVSHSDGEVISHLYEEYGEECLGRLEGQFAIAIADVVAGTVLLARDQMGICPLHWAETDDGLYFCSEAKGLLRAGAGRRQLDPVALLQLAYFGAVCAPRTAFREVQALPPAHYLRIGRDGSRVQRRYWNLTYPTTAQQRTIGGKQAIAELRTRLEAAVESCTQGEFPATCFLSGGVDSATVAALLARRAGSGHRVQAFCAAADHPRIDEGDDAQSTAQALGVNLIPTRITERDIAAVFSQLVWHAEMPAISTEAAALFLLAGQVRQHSKVVLTGEGADEAFGGYLAFRQAKLLHPVTRNGLAGIRAAVRRQLTRHYGTDCLLPEDARMDAVRGHLGCFPAQAREWEFYRAAVMPLLAPHYREMLACDRQWEGFLFDRAAVRGRHWLNQSLYVGYQVMLPNYLLGPHGDRLFAGNSVEGRYPFLDHRVVEYAATLPPGLKIRYLREKYVLRQAARQWLPDNIAGRPKTRFVMPFGTPFLSPRAPAIYAHLLAPDTLRDYGYFDPVAVRRVIDATLQKPSASGARAHLERLGLGIALTLVCSTQLWHHLYIDQADDPARDAPQNVEHGVTG
jgi:asparagine synthase (glutamine-hydrolysing)